MSAPTPACLPRSAIPSHYELTVRTDLVEGTFSGTCEIDLQVDQPLDAITIHVAPPLKLGSAVLGRVGHDGLVDEVRRLVDTTTDEKLERATLGFEGGTISEGTYKLGCRWDGILDGSLAGYYAATHVDHVEGTQKKTRYTMTQFQPCDARRAYPCFDEPDLKATFSISLISRVGTTSLSNQSVDSSRRLKDGGAFPRTPLLTEAFFSSTTEDHQTDGDEWEIVHFKVTPRMSTYLAAWANGDFSFVEGGCHSEFDNKFISMRIYTLPHQIHQANLALKASERILPIIERFFDIPYPLEKLDTLATPGFGNGAMENWGLVIGGSSIYLVDDDNAGVAAQKMLKSVASHEIAHHWYGNIVTMKWWDNLWLNESFATLMGEVIVIDELEPSWKIHSSFISEHLSRALDLDALRSSHPIEMPCPDEATINQIFDAVSYSKGGSVLKMLSNFIGQDKFLKGVSTYLKRHLYGNATTADLFKGISDVYGKDIAPMMENWTTKIGFPLITVEETENGLKIRQNRFLSTADATPEEDQTIWQIPLQPLIVEGGNKTIKHGVLLADREDTFEIKDVQNAIYKLNAETCGVYRVLYPADRLVKIGEEAGKENSVFSLNDRMGLVQDASVLASSGYAKTSTALSFLSKLGNETENLVWQEIASALANLSKTWSEQPTPTLEGIDNLRRSLFRPILARLGFENASEDDSETIELRNLAISTLAAAGDPAVLAEVSRRFGAFLDSDDESQIPSDLRASIYSESVKLGSDKEYRKICAVYQDPPTPGHRKAARIALCSSRDPVLVRKTLALMLSDELPLHELPAFGNTLKASNPVASHVYWEWFKVNYDDILTKFHQSARFYLSNMVSSTFGGFSSRKDYQDVAAFFADKDRSDYEQAYAQGLDAILSRSRWLERDTRDVEDWLSSNGYL